MPPADITVVIPAWGAHARDFLVDAVASIRSQSQPARILVVDNAGDPPLNASDGVDVVRSPTRLTVGGARNLGLVHTDTPFVVFWDADDVMLPDTLAALAAHLVAAPDVVLAAAAIIEDDGRDHGWPRRWLAPLTAAPRIWTLLHGMSSLFPTTGAVLIRTEALRDAGGFPEVDGSTC